MEFDSLLRPLTPAATDTGWWHYTYIVRDTLTGQWYGGKHSTRNIKDKYTGSGKWVLSHPNPSQLSLEFKEFFSTREAALAAEKIMIPENCWVNDPFCMNLIEGGRRNFPNCGDPLTRNTPKQIFFSSPEIAEIDAAIGRSGAGNFSGWARQILLAAAREEIKE